MVNTSLVCFSKELFVGSSGDPELAIVLFDNDETGGEFFLRDSSPSDRIGVVEDLESYVTIPRIFLAL